jgi:hypothetical protein
MRDWTRAAASLQTVACGRSQTGRPPAHFNVEFKWEKWNNIGVQNSVCTRLETSSDQRYPVHFARYEKLEHTSAILASVGWTLSISVTPESELVVAPAG